MPKWGKIIHANRLARLEPTPRGAGVHAGKQRVGDVSRKDHVTNSKGASSSISRGIRDCLQHSITDKATELRRSSFCSLEKDHSERVLNNLLQI